MCKVLIYGCGYVGKKVIIPLQTMFHYDVVAYIDKNESLYGKTYLGVSIYGLNKIQQINYDLILIALSNLKEAREAKETLEQIGVEENKIKLLYYDPEYIELYTNQRMEFIQDFALWAKERKIAGNVAECGVFRGDSAKFINRYFSERKLYLFDTFEGFNRKDLNYEVREVGEGFNKEFFTEALFHNTSLDEIFLKMMTPENVIIKKGYFPESTEDVNDRFCFVNLDMDLYMPMLNGLRFFWNRMEDGGCILLHDYFHQGLKGVKKAVFDFEHEIGITLNKMPIGDHISLAILK